MRTQNLHRMLVLAAMIMTVIGAQSSPFCSMSSDDLLRLLPTSSAQAASSESVSAKDTDLGSIRMPMEVTVRDMLTKVYGVMDSGMNRSECLQASERIPGVVAEAAGDSLLWLDEGYGLNYRGMNPEVAAVARFNGEEGEVADYCFFFQFPHKDVKEQCAFSSSLLEDINAIGAEPGVNVESDDLYNVIGVYDGNLVDVRLVDDSGMGRYVLILCIEPGAFAAADDIAAL